MNEAGSGDDRRDGIGAPDEHVDPVAFGETWTFEGLIGAVPGLSIRPATAVAVQVVGFEAALLALAALYGLWDAAVAGTVAVAVAGAGSAITLYMGKELRALELPEAYRRLAFGSRIEIVLSVLAYVALVTYLFAAEPIGGGERLIESLLGESPPIPAVYLALLLAWDLVYRIGTAWWASVAAVWRSWRYEFDDATAAAIARADALPLGFALLQLGLVPIVWDRPLLLGALLGHVLAVAAAVGLSIALLRR